MPKLDEKVRWLFQEDSQELGDEEISVEDIDEEILEEKVTQEMADNRVDQLEDKVWDIETELERLNEKYDRYLEDANREEGYSRERLLRKAHDVRVRMDSLDTRLDELKDRLELWRELKELKMLSGLSSDELEGTRIEELDVDELLDEVKTTRREMEKGRERRDELGNELEAALDWGRSGDRYRREREESAARANDGARVLRRDEELRRDFEEVKADN